MENIYGNIQGLKSSHIKQLQRLYEQRQPGDRLTTPEFAERLAAISTEIHQPVCSYIKALKHRNFKRIRQMATGFCWLG